MLKSMAIIHMVHAGSFLHRVIAQYSLPSQLAWSPSFTTAEVNMRKESTALPIFLKVAILSHQPNTHLSLRKLLYVTGDIVTTR